MLVRRKRDGNLYSWSGAESLDHPGHVRLVPKWEGRTTYKSIGRFKKEFVYHGDGQPIKFD